MSGPPHARIGLLVNPTSRRGLAERDGIHAARCLRALGFDVVDLTAGSAEKAARMSSAARSAQVGCWSVGTARAMAPRRPERSAAAPGLRR